MPYGLKLKPSGGGTNLYHSKLFLEDKLSLHSDLKLKFHSIYKSDEEPKSVIDARRFYEAMQEEETRKEEEKRKENLYKSIPDFSRPQQPKSVYEDKGWWSRPKVITFESIKRIPLEIPGDNISIAIKGDDHRGEPPHFDHTTWVPHIKSTTDKMRIDAFSGETIDRDIFGKAHLEATALGQLEKALGKKIKL